MTCKHWDCGWCYHDNGPSNGCVGSGECTIEGNMFRYEELKDGGINLYYGNYISTSIRDHGLATQIKNNIDSVDKMRSLCNEWFKNPIVQPYGSEDKICRYCGVIEGGGHSFSDCPHLKYMEIKNGN